MNVKEKMILSVLIVCVLSSGRKIHADNRYADCIASVASVSADTVGHKRKVWQRFLAYFNDANKIKKQKKFDVSFIGGPHYSSDTKLGIGLVAAGVYRSDRLDSLLQPSNVALYGDVTTVGFYLLGIRGTHIFPHDRYRLNYNAYFFSFPSLYWGNGYHHGVNDANRSAYKLFQTSLQVDFMIRVARNFYLGPKAMFEYIRGSKFQRPELWAGERTTTTGSGIGGTLLYDSRDFLPNAYRGYYLRIDQRFSPRFMGNKDAFSSTELTTSYYHSLWKGGILASQFHTKLTYGDPPWGLLATLGNSNSMRGYYDGRYRDKCAMDAQVELRQHVWRRNGVTAWVGAGTVFPHFGGLRAKHILPNYGIGYRWEFKKRMNVRLDYGFGKHQNGFIFNINEAF
ncbi:MAG: outer membrane protein assembly factor [Prevotellaceae bacterium]|jgi:hypothetical protein|nr:outer membrane protein assembly factor [Prevotellaceae bacterium]